MKRKLIFIFTWLLGACGIQAQSIIEPNYALKSHETLELNRVEVSASGTVLFFTIENKISGGSFCADRNIYLIEPDGTRLLLVKAKGIPACPDSYKFKGIGEKLQFSLEFPPLKTGDLWADIVEDCSDNCFSFYGITLSSGLNTKINEAIDFASRGENNHAIALYKNIIENKTDEEAGIIGGIYSDIILLSLKAGDKTGAGEWYKKLLAAKVPRLEMYIKNLNSRGIKF
jgi:hypothetical protein